MTARCDLPMPLVADHHAGPVVTAFCQRPLDHDGLCDDRPEPAKANGVDPCPACDDPECAGGTGHPCRTRLAAAWRTERPGHTEARSEPLLDFVATVRAWASENEIAAPPLDWRGLGTILAAAEATARGSFCDPDPEPAGRRAAEG